MTLWVPFRRHVANLRASSLIVVWHCEFWRHQVFEHVWDFLWYGSLVLVLHNHIVELDALSRIAYTWLPSQNLLWPIFVDMSPELLVYESVVKFLYHFFRQLCISLFDATLWQLSIQIYVQFCLLPEQSLVSYLIRCATSLLQKFDLPEVLLYLFIHLKWVNRHYVLALATSLGL